jgi:hypothetical protein
MDSSDSGMELVVRPIEARDAADVFLLTEQLGYERPREAILEWIERVASDTMSQGAYVACLGDEVVGWIEVSLERRLQTAPFALIGGLVVKEGFRGVEAVRVTSRDTRADAHRFYLRDGYRLVKTSLVFEKKRPG